MHNYNARSNFHFHSESNRKKRVQKFNKLLQSITEIKLDRTILVENLI